MGTRRLCNTPLALTAAGALLAGQVLLQALVPEGFGSPFGSAVAADHGGGHSGGGRSGGPAGRGGGHSGHDSGGHDTGGHDTGGHDSGHASGGSGKGKGRGRGGESDGSEHGRGHDGGGSKAVENKVFRDQGGPPAWARGGIPEVELGRLNVARSPRAIEKAWEEAQATVAAGGVPHSPPQSLAMYRDLVTRDPTAAAQYLAQAADKGTRITEDTVRALNTILGVSPDLSGYVSGQGRGNGIAGFAADADARREEIADAHGHGE